MWTGRGDLLGRIILRDDIRPQAAGVLAALRAEGLRSVVLTGDRAAAAEHLRHELGLEDVRAELKPEEKVAAIRELTRQGKHVAMVGDGVNDAPALGCAAVGIAIGAGSDIAKETGDVVLIKGDLRDVVLTLQLAHATMRTIRQNLWWAFGYNLIGVPVAALGYLNPMLAGAAMALSSLSVVVNSALLKRADLSRL